MIEIDKGLLHIEGEPESIWEELRVICKVMYNKTKKDIGEDNAKKLLKATATLSMMTEEEQEELEKKAPEEVKEILERSGKLL